MPSTTVVLLVISILVLCSALSTTAHVINCSKSFLEEVKDFPKCKKLTSLGVEFAWKMISKQNESQHTFDIVFGTRLENQMGWLAWGVNPLETPQMVGTRAIIGIRQPNGSLTIDTYNITSETKMGCKLQPSPIDIDVEFQNRTIHYAESMKYFIMRATVVLPQVYKISQLNHVWQVGYYAEGTEPKMHPTDLQNVDSTETIDLNTGWAQHAGRRRWHLRTIHGILNIAGWGTFLPIGVMIARYFIYPFGVGKWWYPLHVSCQIVGYSLGTAGWVIGLWLGHASRHYSFGTHRLFGIFIFAFATLQMLALRLKPEPDDEYRKQWNMYHHFLGYALLVVISINIFKGIAILKADQRWKWAYIGILGFFGVAVTSFEIITWIAFKREKQRSQAPQSGKRSSEVKPTSSPQ